MSLRRHCDACGKELQGQTCIELGIRVLRVTDADSQDPIDQRYGDYCRVCLDSGKALADLRGDLPETVLLELRWFGGATSVDAV